MKSFSNDRGSWLSALAFLPCILLPEMSFAQYMGPSVALPPALANAPEYAISSAYGDVAIAPGDVISIATVGAPELTTTAVTSSVGIAMSSNASVLQGAKVGASGDIVLPYLGSVKLAGLTTLQAARYLREELKDGGFLVDPQVSVAIVDSPIRFITVIGEVAKQGPVSAFGNVSLLEVIAACGGLTPMASHRIAIRRVGAPDLISIELGTDTARAGASDIPLVAGDRVMVPKVGSVFVLGYVKTPSAIPLSGNAPITVLRALALAGGVNYGAGLSKARIIRTTEDQHQVVIPLDLRKIMFGHQADVALLSNDILLVPANAFKAGMAGGGAGVAAALLYGISGTATVLK